MKASPARVLVADDDVLTRRLLRLAVDRDAALELVGEAADGAEALALAHALVPDVVVLDISMPGLDGLAVAARVRPALPDCAIVMFSASGGEAQALAVGADCFVEKAAGVDAVVRAATAVLSRRGPGGSRRPASS
jgi:DNA-binding NarL/FixJ family response regulator